MTAAPDVVPRGLLDTSVVIALDEVEQEALPEQRAISAITFAELAAGPHATDDENERARRQDRLQRMQTLVDPLPFDAAAARAYARVFAATRARGRKPRGHRAVDLFIAAIALAEGLPLFTRNASDFHHLGAVGLDVREV